MKRPTHTTNPAPGASHRRPAASTIALIASLIAAAVLGAPAALAATLPDGRGYELVSPADKGSANVMSDSARVRAAVSDAGGMAASFASLGGFADVRGTGVGTEYLAKRSSSPTPGSQGWQTHAITPLQSSMSYLGIVAGADPSYVGDFSADLSKAVFRAWTPLTDAPNVARLVNLYRRDDLRSPGAGAYRLLTDAPALLGSDTDFIVNIVASSAFAGASGDFEHVIFESGGPHAAGVPDDSARRLYEWDHGTIRVAGILPDGSIAPGSVAGQGASTNLVPHVISEDGQRITFTVPNTGDLYQRVEHTTTIHLNASERATPDPNGVRPATYWDASTDGTRVFFTSAEALTEDAPLDGDRKVYMYDASRPASDPDNLTYLNLAEQPLSHANDADGVIGVSADGRYAYFVTTGEIVAGAPPLGGGRGIFLWHDDGTANGTLRQVGVLPNVIDAIENLSGSVVLNPLLSRVAPSGQHLVFSASSDPSEVGYDHGRCLNGTPTETCRQLYLYSADDGGLACVSCHPGGAPATADAEVRVRTETGGATTSSHLSRALSDDGSRVFFHTAGALVSGDVNGKTDVYEYDAASGEAHLISSGTGSAPSYFMDASANGDDVFFTTRAQLVGWDVDDSVDLYDARVGGGFPEPQPAAPGCSGEGCRGPLSVPPSARSFGTAGARGSGNVSERASRGKAKPRCGRGKVRKRVRGKARCVRRSKHRASRRPGHGKQQRRSK